MLLTESIPARLLAFVAPLTVLLAAVAGCTGSPSSTGNEVVAADSNAAAAAIAYTANRVAVGEESPPSLEWSQVERLPNVPAWAVDAVFYQIFPERFRNGDPANDPTHQSLEFPDVIPTSWKITPWTSDFYARADWEQQSGDSFYENGVFNRRYGGDLQGVIDKLDYLEKLGVSAIYFNPVFYGRSLHKYDSASIHHIDPYFGPDPSGDLKLIADESSDPKSWHWTAADKLFLELLAAAHRRGMRVVIDGVFNHTGRDFFAFEHLRDHQQDSPYGDWYIVQHYDDPATPANEFRYKGWWGIDTLPEFANNAAGDDLHEGPRQYLMEITSRWMDPNGDGDPADGVDGWRLDVAEEVPLNFWKSWNARVRELNPQAYTVAEIWNDARTFLIGGGFSATMNYHAFAYLAKGFLMDGRLSAHDFGRELLLRRQKYPPAMQFALQNLVDSHDTDRLASMLVNHPGDAPYRNGDRFDFDESGVVSPRQDATYSIRKPNAEERRLQRLVVLLQMTYLGAPMVYYGDEVGMWGGDDPCCRKPMLWDDLQFEPEASDPLDRPRQADDVAADLELLDFYRRVIALRHSQVALRRGSCATSASDDDAKFFAFYRELDGKRLFVALNRGDESYAWQPPDGATAPQPASSLKILLATGQGAEIRAATDGTPPTVFLPARTGVVIAAQSP